jgi:hypothetical protein
MLIFFAIFAFFCGNAALVAVARAGDFAAFSRQINGSAYPGTIYTPNPGFSGENPVKPSQTQSNHFFTLTRP